MKLINDRKLDIVFLDIEMPFSSGFNLLEMVDEINFNVIFTTGFNQYAIAAIKFSALDCLLKPIILKSETWLLKKPVKRTV